MEFRRTIYRVNNRTSETFIFRQDNNKNNKLKKVWSRVSLFKKRPVGASIKTIANRTIDFKIKCHNDAIKLGRGCTICLEKYKTGDSLKMLPCMHTYHKGCISKWLKVNGVCCICRENITSK